MDGRDSFGVVDYLVFVSSLLGSVAIGAFFAVKSKQNNDNTEEYFVGSRKMSLLPVSMSMVVSFISAVLIIGIPAEVYLYGGMMVLSVTGGTLGALLCAVLVVPLFYKLQLTSINEYFERRFHSPAPKYIASAANVAFGIVYTGIVLYAPATTISAVTGMPSWSVILVSWLVTVIYTSIGGMKAVVWTDFFQTFIMLAGMLATVVQGIRLSGGVSKSYELMKASGRLDLWDFDFDMTKRFTFWSVAFTAILDHMFLRGATQASVQRYCGLETLFQAKLSILVSLVGSSVFFICGMASGMAIFAYYADNECDPLAAGIISNPNQLVPRFVLDTLNYPGVPGLFVAALCTASLSSASSVLNSAAANTWEDVLKPRFPSLSETKAVFISKILVVVYGTMSLSVCFMVENLGGTIAQVGGSFAVTILVPTVGMVALACIVPWANWKGATAGGSLCFIFLFWMAMGSYSVERHVTDMLPSFGVAGCASFLNGTGWYQAADSNHTVPQNSSLDATTDLMRLNSTSSEKMEIENSFILDPLYRVSFMWYGNIGICFVIVVGALVSLCTGCARLTDTDAKLMFPFISHFIATTQTSDESRGADHEWESKPMVEPINGGLNGKSADKNFADIGLMKTEERTAKL